jgi:uncharacterized membrane protein HdeD (DUF308 family)
MTSNVTPAEALRDSARTGARDLSAAWWWFLALGILWIGFGMFVLSYRVESLAAVAAFAGVAFIFGGVTQIAVATQAQSWQWLYFLSGALALIAGIIAFAWPDVTLYALSILVAWYLVIFGIMHVVTSLGGPKVPWWWTGLLLGIAEVALGVWAVRSWERSLFTLVTLVGIWAVVHGMNQIFAGFSLRQIGKRVDDLVGSGSTG